MIRNLLLLPLLALLAGCVTYYYPAPEATSDGVYYAQEEPAYQPAYSGYATAYAAPAYYPWWSMDYFYLGYGYGSGSLSFGLSFGYPAYYGGYAWYGYPVYAYGWYGWPYYGYCYPPYRYAWRPPYYHHYHGHYDHPGYAWNQSYWNHKYGDYRREAYPHRDRDPYVYGDSRGYRDGMQDPRNRQVRDAVGTRPPRAFEDRSNARGPETDPGGIASRAHGPTPGSSADGPMLVRSRADAKPGMSRLHETSPAETGPTVAAARQPSPPAEYRRLISQSPRAGQPNKVVVIGDQAGAKPGRERIYPVAPEPGPRVGPATSTGSFSVVSTPRPPLDVNRGTSQVRYLDGGKSGPSRTHPVGVEQGQVIVSSPPPPTQRPDRPVRVISPVTAQSMGSYYRQSPPQPAPGYRPAAPVPQPSRGASYPSSSQFSPGGPGYSTPGPGATPSAPPRSSRGAPAPRHSVRPERNPSNG